jgi:hypothetical protein
MTIVQKSEPYALDGVYRIDPRENLEAKLRSWMAITAEILFSCTMSLTIYPRYFGI